MRYGTTLFLGTPKHRVTSLRLGMTKLIEEFDAISD